MTITYLNVLDIRFPTSRDNVGTDGATNAVDGVR